MDHPDDQLLASAPTWWEIDCGTVMHHLRQLQGLLGPQVLVYACLKGDASGSGAIARCAEAEGAGGFAFGNVEVAAACREAGSGVQSRSGRSACRRPHRSYPDTRRLAPPSDIRPLPAVRPSARRAGMARPTLRLRRGLGGRATAKRLKYHQDGLVPEQPFLHMGKICDEAGVFA